MPLSGFFVWWNTRRKAPSKAEPAALADLPEKHPRIRAMPVPAPWAQAALEAAEAP